MEMVVDFPGGVRVDAHFGSFTVHTDQPQNVGGEDTAPAPFELFLASLATCTGFYIVSFCRKRDISTEGMRLIQNLERDPETGYITTIRIDVELPPDFPEKYVAAITRTAQQCAVKKVLQNPPAIQIEAHLAGQDA